MLSISIIIPIFKVQGFLRECLDSILASPYPHLEVIGVDDCSPDQSGMILAEYAAADSRVKALRTPHNSGSGAARNLGLDAATGDYVWFADSDDLIAPGAIDELVAALSDRPAEELPQVLLFDYQRLTESGELLGSDLPGIVARAGEPPASFDFAGWPAVADYTHTTWNKLVRRDYLLDLGLRFHPGWYQDVPWTYPLLIDAERLALLNKPCYQYRQRRSGSVTRTRTERHTEVFTQWERVWEWLGPPDGGPISAAIFNRMIWHCMQILGNADRVTPAARRDFFHRIAALFARWRPEQGYRKPGGAEGGKHDLLRRDWYLGYLATRFARRAYNRLRWGHPYGRYSSRGHAHAFRAMAHRLRRQLSGAGGMAGFGGLYYRCQRLFRPRRDLVVFATQGYGPPGGAVAGIHDRLATVLDHDRVWLSASPRPGDVAVRPGSAAFYRALARAAYVIADFEPGDFLVKRPGTVHVRALPHTPVTPVGLDRLRIDGGSASQVDRLLDRMDRWDFVVSPNRHSSEIIDRAFQVHARTLEYGSPATVLSPGDKRRQEIRRVFGVDDDRPLVGYHPARRPDGMPAPDFDLPRLQRLLPGAEIISIDETSWTRSGDGTVVTSALPAGFDAAELYRAADLMIGDYHGAVVDRAVGGAPVVLYLPDWHDMRTAGHVTADLVAEPPGPVAHGWDRLVDELTRQLRDDRPAVMGEGFARRFGPWQDGDAAEQVIREVFALPQSPHHDRPSTAVPTMPINHTRTATGDRSIATFTTG